MDAASNSLGEARTVAIMAVELETSPISEGNALRERLHSTAEALETRISMTSTRIPRFPHRLRGIGGADNCHVVPSMVAIGPYHHGLPHLQEMEEVKQAAAHRLCGMSGRSVEEVYEKILSVAGDARRCYDDVSVAGLSDAEFATMMFVDASFLVWYLAAHDDKLFPGLVLSSEPNIEKDIFMLENQIPWLVLRAIMENTNNNDVWLRASYRLGDIRPRKEEKKKRWMAQWWQLCFPDPMTGDDDHGRSDDTDSIIQRCMPMHLLGLLRFSLICRMPLEKRESKFTFGASTPLTTTCRTAFELAQVGIKLAANKARWFADMNCVKKPVVFGELSLSPLYLTDVTTCWLVNMAALESVELSAAQSFDKDGYVISSYLSTLAMLMDREEDVQELRRSDVVKTNFTNTETLAFFKGIGKHLRQGINYFNTLAEIDRYIRQRPVTIVIHRFLYNNYKYIVAVMSIASVLVGIFKAIYSLKKP
ncbi:unnamed protein product [Urochloa decumbens]|uniref:Uncharacterized protein n=1 Tax=Urochloa decumbens TaxID=240449 RepID=A0ABC9BPG1_9POAL